MGNHDSKGAHETAGSPSDFFLTAPNSPSEVLVAAMASSSAPATSKTQALSLPESTSISPNIEWIQRLTASSDWSIISTDSKYSSGTMVTSRGPTLEQSDIGLEDSASTCREVISELSWEEKDSGMEPQGTAERAREDLTLALFGVMDHYKTTMNVNAFTDLTSETEELIRRLISEKGELVEEVDTLRETLKSERSDWHQFQCDLQIAVSVADRLRVEMEEELSFLKKSHNAVKEQLAKAVSRQQDTERELESLRTEHKDICQKLNQLTAQQQKERMELDFLRNVCRMKRGHRCERNYMQETGTSEPREEEQMEEGKTDTKNEIEPNQVDTENGVHEPQRANEIRHIELTGKGVAEGYIRSLAALEKKKDDRGQREQRKIVMLSERSWSLTRITLQNESSNQNETTKNLGTVSPLCKKEEPTKGSRMLKRQDSWSSFSTGKHEEDQSSDSVKPQDNFSALLRRHGGSRRNSLLHWCQSRTQGYKNIEITNFSSSWEDGLAFCAIYHTYLPDDIPYDNLRPADKKENLQLAFGIGLRVGIPATLTVDDMLKTDGPNWQSVLAYVERIFRHFEM